MKCKKVTNWFRKGGVCLKKEKRILNCRKNNHANYSGDLNNKLVQYSNGPK